MGYSDGSWFDGFGCGVCIDRGYVPNDFTSSRFGYGDGCNIWQHDADQDWLSAHVMFTTEILNHIRSMVISALILVVALQDLQSM